jgi:hypothetical protein
MASMCLELSSAVTASRVGLPTSAEVREQRVRAIRELELRPEHARRARRALRLRREAAIRRLRVERGGVRQRVEQEQPAARDHAGAA